MREHHRYPLVLAAILAMAAAAGAAGCGGDNCHEECLEARWKGDLE
ncbi:hypothetical protein ACMHYB_38330 [Sorangium sp. So ce1128]